MEYLSSLFQFVFQLILERNRHPILAECSHTNELTEEDGDIPMANEEDRKSQIDDMTGDYEEVPQDDFVVVSEYDHLLYTSIRLLSSLFEFQPIYQHNVSAFYSFCYGELQKSVVLVSQSDWNPELQDCSTILRVITNLSFNEHNIDILLLLSNLIK